MPIKGNVFRDTKLKSLVDIKRKRAKDFLFTDRLYKRVN